MNIQSLRFPQKSHRKIITIPKNSVTLAEFMGIFIGDGGVSNDWQLVISLNSERDAIYSIYVRNLLKSLFNLKAAIRKRPNQNTLVVVCSSISLVDFIVEKGAKRGNKILQKIDVPKWVSTNRDFKKAFLRGLMDTDGCLYIHKHTVAGKSYRNLGLCFTSYSENLLLSVASIFREFDIKPHIPNNHRIYLYSQKDVIKYLNVFGSSNPRITDVAKNWWGV